VSDTLAAAREHPRLKPHIDAATEAIAVDLRHRPTSDALLATILPTLSWRSYQAGRADAIAELLTVADVAALLGVTADRVRKLAATGRYGWRIDGRTWLFRAEDVEAMRERAKPGRPRKPS